MEFLVEHIGLPSRDAEALKQWYIEKLGATVAYTNNQTPPYLLRLAGDAMIEIYAATSAMPEITNNFLAGWRHLALRVKNLEATRDALQQKGVVFPDPIKPAAGGGRILFFQDHDGNLLHLVERPSDKLV
jgi:catechol 2,3-dioxygenase-like lactoylglutathione lyase family enzyme